MRKSLYLITLLLIIGCATEKIYVFEDVPSSVDDTYGYVPENPIQIGYWDMEKSTAAIFYFISSLSTEDGNRLVIIGQMLVDDPLHDADQRVPWYLRYSRYDLYSGLEYIGGLLDIYEVTTEDNSDTLRIYFDTFRPGPIMAPKGLKFIYPADQ